LRNFKLGVAGFIKHPHLSSDQSGTYHRAPEPEPCDLESWREKMKKQASAFAMGALLTLVMIVPSFAQGNGRAKHHFRASPADGYSNYYNSAAGPYGNDSAGDYGGISGAIGGMGH
jgi:hypothetical protein